MSDQYLGEIRMVGFNFAPVGWALCNGQLIAISQNQALFALLGTFYGGDGRTNFALPNLQGRVAIHQGSGPGLSPYVIGQTGGVENATLTSTNLPPHTHTLNASNATGTQSSPAGGSIAQVNTGDPRQPTLASAFVPGTPSVTMAQGSIGNTGNGIPFNVLQPYLCVTFIIALVGIFPSRN